MTPLAACTLALAVGMLWCLILLGSGRRLRAILGFPAPEGSGAAIDLLVGAWLAAMLALVAGLLHGFRPGVLLGVAGALALIGKHRRLKVPPPALLLGLPALVFLPFALAPVFWYDALTYQLALPWQALREGGILAHPENVFAAFPALVQLLASVPLAGGVERAVAVLHLASFLAAAAVVAAIAHGLGAPRWAAWLAAAATPLLPCHRLVPALPAAEGWALLGILVAVRLGFAAATSPRPGSAGPDRMRSAALAGFAAGVATAARLQGLGWSLILILLVAALPAALAARVRIQALALALLGWLVGAAPWWLKNAVLLREPWAPVGWTREGMSSLWRDSESSLALGRAWADVAVHAIRLLMPHTSYLAPLALAVLIALLPRPGRARSALALTVALGLGAWVATGMLPRFLGPTLALLLALAASAAGGSRLGRVAGALALGITLALGIAFNLRQQVDLGGFQLFFLSDTELRARLVNGNPFPAFARAQALELDARVLFIGEPRGFGFPRRLEFSSQHDPPRIREIIEASASTAEARSRLRSLGFTHVLLNSEEMARLATAYPVLPWRTHGGRARFLELVAGLAPPVVEAGPVAIYALGQVAEAAAETATPEPPARP